MKAYKLTSQYLGVSFDVSGSKYTVRVSCNRRLSRVGRFDTEIEAAIAYDNFVRTNNLDKRLNFPDPEPENLIPNTRLIRLTQGKFAVVDEEDFDRVNKYKWTVIHARNAWYAIRTVHEGKGHRTERMSVFILGNKGLVVDHRDGNGLHNYKSNLRICTNGQNVKNRAKTINTKSLFKGVWITKGGKFQSEVRCDNVRYYVGTFNSEIECARAYDMKAKELHGEFSRLNFPNE